MDELKQLREEVLKQFDELMFLIDDKYTNNITEEAIQRQLGATYMLWKRLTIKQEE